MSDNWIVANLENAFNTWNDKMAEIWSLVTTSPQSFKGGTVWTVVQSINGGLQAIGLGLLVLFFAMSVFKSTASFRDFQRPESMVGVKCSQKGGLFKVQLRKVNRHDEEFT